jgi:hypothetical protein
MTGKLDLDPPGGGRGGPAGRAGGQAKPVIEMARTRTTVSVARATLRLAGLSRADPASLSAGEGAGHQVLCRAAPERSASAADVLAAPVVVVRARGTVVIR